MRTAEGPSSFKENPHQKHPEITTTVYHAIPAVGRPQAWCRVPYLPYLALSLPFSPVWTWVSDPRHDGIRRPHVGC